MSHKHRQVGTVYDGVVTGRHTTADVDLGTRDACRPELEEQGFYVYHLLSVYPVGEYCPIWIIW